MFKKLLATIAALTFISAAFAGGQATVTAVPYVQPAMDIEYDIPTYEGEGHQVFDLGVDVWDADKATTFHAIAYTWCVTDPGMGCGTFWEHPLGANTQPNPALFGAYGLLEYDTFWTSTEEWPNPDVDPTKDATALAPGSPLQTLPNLYECEWYVDPADPEVDGGQYTIARYNLMVDCEACECPPGMGACVPYDTGFDPCCYFTVEGEIYFASTAGIPWSFSVDVPICWCTIPEPGSIALLALGSLALIRRR